MKFAVDATYSSGEQPSGVGIYSRELLSRLPAAHPDTQFLFCYRSHRYFRTLRERLPVNCKRRLLFESSAYSGADLFHGLNQRLPKTKLRRAVSTFHDLFVLTGDYSTANFRRRFAEQARHAAANSEHIITVSEFTASQVEQLLGVERSRLHVVHHGVRKMLLQPLKRERIILHVGAIQRRKNISRLVEAFEAMPAGWQLVLIGAAGFEAAEIHRRIEESPRCADIQVLGYVPDRDLPKWYARASIFAFPSLDEGFGMPVLEAMAAGVPVVTSNRSALPEVSGDAALLVDPTNTEELASALRRLADDDQLRDELTQNGQRRAAQFTWEAATSRTWEVYEVALK